MERLIEPLSVLKDKPGISTGIAPVSTGPISVAGLSVLCPGDDRELGLQSGKIY